MEGGRCGKSPGGRRTTPGEEVGSGCTYSEVTTMNATDGGGGRREEDNSTTQKSGRYRFDGRVKNDL